MEPEKQYLIDAELVQGILNYLSTRPYAEVHQAIPALLALKEADAPVAETAEAE